MAEPMDPNALIIEFCSLTGAEPSAAEQHLTETQWDLSAAVSEYYSALEEAPAGGNPSDNDEGDLQGQPPINGRTLDGGVVRAPAGSSPATRGNPARSTNSRFATIGQLNQRQGNHSAGHGHSHDDDDDDDEDEDSHEPQDFFAGGEKSGLAVQNPKNPRNHVNAILKKAMKKAAKSSGEQQSSERNPRFSGQGQTLGGDDVPSQVIPDPYANIPQPVEPNTRILHIWQNGFSVDDGPNYLLDDPANSEILATIRRGSAPLSILNVQPGEIVDVQIQQHQENYRQLKKAYKPFSGGGQRLGSPTPGFDSAPHSQPRPAQTVMAATPLAPTTAPAAVSIDNSQPSVSLQIRLGDGTRLVSRFNTTQTIGDVYSFVSASSSNASTRPWVLMTTFPSQELKDKRICLGELPEFKRGGVIVQKWQ